MLDVKKVLFSSLLMSWLLMMMSCLVVLSQEARKSDNQYIGYCTATEDCSGPQNAIWYNPDLHQVGFLGTCVSFRSKWHKAIRLSWTDCNSNDVIENTTYDYCLPSGDAPFKYICKA